MEKYRITERFLNKGDRYYTIYLGLKLVIITRNKKIVDEYKEINEKLSVKTDPSSV